jgi:hypothetical protein
VAVNEARQFISAGELLADRDWSTPVLYLGTRNGQVMNLLAEEAGEVEKVWHRVQSAAQTDAQAAAALDDLTRRLKELSNQHRGLRNLLDLSEHVRKLRDAFAPCAAEPGPGGTLTFAQFPVVTQKWSAVKQGPLVELEVFLDNLPAADKPAWAESIKQAASAIDGDINNIALQALARGVGDFAAALAQAQSRVQQRLGQAITDLVDLANQTLGRLDSQ